TSQELWRVLLKYLTPVSSIIVDEDGQTRDKDELLKKLQINFAKSNQTVFTDIVEAVDVGDIKLAHRLAHTLKGNAGQIGKTGLRNIAAEVETLLAGGTSLVTDDKMALLKTELTLVLEELQPLLDERAAVRNAANPLNAEEVSALFEKIESMLENINPEVMNLLDDVRAIPGTEKLACLIEDYNFESAAQTLADLKGNLFRESIE
ncbi:MAG: Hpt domain-containing protein, partial [Chitinispirillales bacterium]|nr:Hpt domain-containing protein [Chitinispirillales bacterium]